MKKFILIFMSMVMVLTACGRGNIDQVKIAEWEPSAIYTDEEIEAAFQTVKDYFYENFSGCTLIELYYPGDSSQDEFQELAKEHNADKAIIIYSTFDVDSSGGDGSLNPNSTYEGWSWSLILNKDGEWEHVDHGYA